MGLECLGLGMAACGALLLVDDAGLPKVSSAIKQSEEAGIVQVGAVLRNVSVSDDSHGGFEGAGQDLRGYLVGSFHAPSAVCV